MARWRDCSQLCSCVVVHGVEASACLFGDFGASRWGLVFILFLRLRALCQVTREMGASMAVDTPEVSVVS